MTETELIDEHVSSNQCKKAIQALHSYQTKKDKEASENELLPGKEQHIWLVVGVKRMYPEKKLKPFKIPIAHPLVDPRTSSVCLITKDPQREYKDLLEKHGIKFISRVVGILKLKGKFKPFDARRQLLQENGLFLADERVIPLLPKLLGKKWFDAKKQPIPVCLTRKDLKGELERAISSTYMHQNRGTCTSIKIGTASQTPAQVFDNLNRALPAIVKTIRGGWENIQSLQIKSNSSASLPIWNCNLDDESGGRWDGFTVRTDEVVEGGKGKDEGESESESESGMDKGEEGEEEDSEKGAEAPAKSKGKKRAIEEVAVEAPPSKIPKQAVDLEKGDESPRKITKITKTKKVGHAEKPTQQLKTKKSTKEKVPVQKIESEPPSSTRVSKTKPTKGIISSNPTRNADTTAHLLSISKSDPLSTTVPQPSKIKYSKTPEIPTSTKKSKLSKVTFPNSSPASPEKKSRSNQALSDNKEAALVSSVKNVTLTPAELKQKRVTIGSDKKKDKLLSKGGKNASGKSTKDKLVGKKAARP